MSNRQKKYAYDEAITQNLYQIYQKRNKQAIIHNFLNELQKAQLDCIDAAVRQSDMKEAKEVIEYIMSKK